MFNSWVLVIAIIAVASYTFADDVSLWVRPTGLNITVGGGGGSGPLTDSIAYLNRSQQFNNTQTFANTIQATAGGINVATNALYTDTDSYVFLVNGLGNTGLYFSGATGKVSYDFILNPFFWNVSAISGIVEANQYNAHIGMVAPLGAFTHTLTNKITLGAKNISSWDQVNSSCNHPGTCPNIAYLNSTNTFLKENTFNNKTNFKDSQFNEGNIALHSQAYATPISKLSVLGLGSGGLSSNKTIMTISSDTNSYFKHYCNFDTTDLGNNLCGWTNDETGKNFLFFNRNGTMGNNIKNNWTLDITGNISADGYELGGKRITSWDQVNGSATVNFWWNNRNSSRALDTIYNNTNGYDIIVRVSIESGVNIRLDDNYAFVRAFSNNTLVAEAGIPQANGTSVTVDYNYVADQISFMVLKDNNYYINTYIKDGNVKLAAWVEDVLP